MLQRSHFSAKLYRWKTQICILFIRTIQNINLSAKRTHRDVYSSDLHFLHSLSSLLLYFCCLVLYPHIYHCLKKMVKRTCLLLALSLSTLPSVVHHPYCSQAPSIHMLYEEIKCICFLQCKFAIFKANIVSFDQISLLSNNL